MGVATGITATKMLELANGFLVNGAVDANGNLILANRGGQTVNAGNVRGPKGDTGLKGDKGLTGDVGPKGADAAVLLTPMSVTDLPSAYPTGISTFSISDATTNGVWPSWPGTVETIRHGVNRTIQLFAEKITGKTWIRTENDSNGWGVWNQSSFVGHTHDAGTDIVSGTLPNARLSDDVPRARGGVASVTDWNTLTLAATYDASSPLGANSPSGAYAWGVLEVSTSALGNTTSQRYYPHGSPRSFYQRVRYGSTAWSAWAEHQNLSDLKTSVTGWVSDTAAPNILPSRLQPTAQLVASGTDIRTIKNSGFYRGTGLTNAPAGSTDWWYYEIIRHDDTYVNYMAYDYHSSRVYRGYWNSSVWSGWTMIVDAYGDTGYTDISTTVALKASITFSQDSGVWGGLKARRVNGFVHFIIENLVVAANYWMLSGGTTGKPVLPADGNIANVLLLDGIPAQFRPPATGIGSLSAGTAGNMNSMYITPNGEAFLAWIEGSSNVASNQTVSGTGMFPGA